MAVRLRITSIPLMFLLLCSALLATTLQGVQGEVDVEGPSESECRPYIEKALKKLETGDTQSADVQDDDITHIVTTDDSDTQSGEAIESIETKSVEEGDGTQEDTGETESVEVETATDQDDSEQTGDTQEVSAEDKTETEEESEQADQAEAASEEQGESEEAADSKEASVEGEQEASTEKDKSEEQKSVEEGEETTAAASAEEGTEEAAASTEQQDEAAASVEDAAASTEQDESAEKAAASAEQEEATSAEEGEAGASAEESAISIEDSTASVEDGTVSVEDAAASVEEAATSGEQQDEDASTEQEAASAEEREATGSAEQESAPASVEEGDASVEDAEEAAASAEQEAAASAEEGEATASAEQEGNASVEDNAASVEDGAASVEDGATSVEDGAASVEEGAVSVENAASTEEGATSAEEDAASTEDAAASTEQQDEPATSAEDAAASVEEQAEASEEKPDGEASAEKIDATSAEQEAAASSEQADEAASVEKEASIEAEGEEKTESVEGEKEESGEKASAEGVTEGESAEKEQDDEASQEGAEEDSEEGEAENTPEEDLTWEPEIPSELRPRDHINEILNLNDEPSDLDNLILKSADKTLNELKKIYENAIKPLETLYKYRDLSNRHFGDPEIFSKPLVLFMGPWSGGKSSIVNYLLDNEYTPTALRTGAEPSPAYFNLLMYGEEPEVLDGTQLAADWTFSGLQKFGQGLEERLRGLKLPNKLLEKINIVEIPGILEVRKQVSRMFPFNDACQWFIDRADIIFLVYDPSKLDVGPETEAILDQLKGREYQTRIILNKADQVKPEELMRVQGALIWNISPLMSSAQPPVMYSTSLWSRPYEAGSPARLLHAQERSFLKDLKTAVDKRIENKIASARRFAVRVRNHAKMVDCYLTTYYNHKSVFGNKKLVSDQIIEHPQDYHIYEGLSTLTNISRYDLPDPDVYRDFFRLNPLYDFQQLSATCTYFRGCPINRLDVAIAYDLPELVGKYKKMVEPATNNNADSSTKS